MKLTYQKYYTENYFYNLSDRIIIEIQKQGIGSIAARNYLKMEITELLNDYEQIRIQDDLGFLDRIEYETEKRYNWFKPVPKQMKPLLLEIMYYHNFNRFAPRFQTLIEYLGRKDYKKAADYLLTRKWYGFKERVIEIVRKIKTF